MICYDSEQPHYDSATSEQPFYVDMNTSSENYVQIDTTSESDYVVSWSIPSVGENNI